MTNSVLLYAISSIAAKPLTLTLSRKGRGERASGDRTFAPREIKSSGSSARCFTTVLLFYFVLPALLHFSSLGATSSWLFTFSLPAISAALASIMDFSSAERTGPFRSTMPSWVMILIL